MILLKLNKTKRYLLYAALPIALLLAGVKFQKIFSYYRTRSLQSKTTSYTRRRLEGKRKHRSFGFTSYINSAASQYIDECKKKGGTYALNARIAHQHLLPIIDDIAGITKEVRKSKPILNKNSYTNMYLFRGSDEKQVSSYCELFSKRMGIQSHVGRYHFFLRLATANGDAERIREVQYIHKYMMKDPKFMYRAKEAISDIVSEEADEMLFRYYLRDINGVFPEMQAIKQVVRAESLVQEFILDGANALGFNLRGMVEESNLGVWAIKMLYLHASDLEILLNIDNFSYHFKRWWNTFSHVVRSTKEDPYAHVGRDPSPNALNGLFISVLSFIYEWLPIPQAVTDAVTSAIKKWIIPQGASGNYFNTILSLPYLIVAWPVHIFKKVLMGLPDLINKTLYMPLRYNLPVRYRRYQNATNLGLKLLKRLNTLHRSAKKIDKAIAHNPELRKLCKPYFDRIYRLRHDKSLKEYRYIIRKFRKLSKEPFTVLELLKPWATRATDMLTLVKKLDEIPEEEEKAIVEALVAICMLDTFVSVSIYAYGKSKRKKKRLDFVMGTLMEQPPLTQSVPKKAAASPKETKPVATTQSAVPKKSTSPKKKAVASQPSLTQSVPKKAAASPKGTKPVTPTQSAVPKKSASPKKKATPEMSASKKKAVATKKRAAKKGKKQVIAKKAVKKKVLKPSPPQLELKEFYNLFVSQRKVVKNDYKSIIDPKTGKQKSMIIHGFNGGGKSIYLIPGLGHNIALLHTIGFAFAAEARFSPIDYLVVSANIKDDASKGLSLMMAEAKVANEHMLRMVDGMDHDEKAIFLVDELFRGTPKKEGAPLLLMLIAYLQQAGNNLTVFSTHADLSELSKKIGYKQLAFFTPGFDAKKNDFTYRINKGLGKHPVCIHVLQKMKFHPEVLKGAINLLKRDKSYRFSAKLRETTGDSWLGAFFTSPLLEKALMLLLMLLIGLFAGMYLPREREKKGASEE